MEKQELKAQHQLSDDDMSVVKEYVDEAMPTSLHDLAFTPALLAQCDPEYVREDG